MYLNAMIILMTVSNLSEYDSIYNATEKVADKLKKKSIDYFKCMSLKRIYLLGASLHYLDPGGIRIS
jgi:hypothetical protein